MCSPFARKKGFQIVTQFSRTWLLQSIDLKKTKKTPTLPLGRQHKDAWPNPVVIAAAKGKRHYFPASAYPSLNIVNLTRLNCQIIEATIIKMLTNKNDSFLFTSYIIPRAPHTAISDNEHLLFPRRTTASQ